MTHKRQYGARCGRSRSPSYSDGGDPAASSDRCGRSRSPSYSDGGDPAAIPNTEHAEATQGKPLKNALNAHSVLFSLAKQILNTAPAERRMRGIGADIRPIVPTTRAFRVRRRRHRHAFLIWTARFDHRCRGRDQHEFQIIAQTGKRLIARAACAHFNVRL